MLVLLDDLSNLVGDTLDAHTWLFVVGRNLGRRNHVALLILELLLDTAVEEECNVRILLSFCTNMSQDYCASGPYTHQQCAPALRLACQATRQGHWSWPEGGTQLGKGTLHCSETW